MKHDHESMMQRGFDEWWWPSWDERGPHPFPIVVGLDDRKISKYDAVAGFPANLPADVKFMSQLLALLGVYDSVAEARKGGWNKPLAAGDFWLKNKTIHIIVGYFLDGEPA